MDQLLETPKAKQMCFPEATYEFLPPFSGLVHLSLAKNKISDDEELLAVCLFPALSKLTIYKNPITLSTGKKPHLVISMLKDRLGIEVITGEPRPVDRPPVVKVFNPKRKVDSHIPKIPKQPPMLETAKQLLGLECGGPGGTQRGGAELRPPGQVDDICTEPMSATHGTCRGRDSIPEPTTGNPEKQHQEAMEEKPVEGFFMTQVEDITLNSEDKVALEIKQTAVPSVTTDLPERYKGYEELLDATTDPYFVEPVGIQQNVQQLERHLRKLQLYPDPFSSVNLQRRPYVPKQRKVSSYFYNFLTATLHCIKLQHRSPLYPCQARKELFWLTPHRPGISCPQDKAAPLITCDNTLSLTPAPSDHVSQGLQILTSMPTLPLEKPPWSPAACRCLPLCWELHAGWIL
ncbi:X-ray radiation resistance-associated protein 1-like isoform X3 [Pristis pectinata]|nr:X-ray radiation resistance-associated protein 1-like isoform X3 [Pristis pectinata]